MTEDFNIFDYIRSESCVKLVTKAAFISVSNNVVNRGSLSRIRSVRRISFGMTTRPRSSILLTIPVAFIKIPPFIVRSVSGNSICK